jgi:hypothetical protein
MTDELPGPRPGRTRVTATRTPGAPSGEFSAPHDLEHEYVRSLIRAQLRLAIACAVGFGLVLLAVPVSIAIFPLLEQVTIGPLPVSWIMLGFSIYPVVIAVAALYVRAAARNEARYRSLAGEE